VTAAAASAAKLLPNGLDNLISNAGVAFTELVSFEEV
jgi:hypothetical protein